MVAFVVSIVVTLGLIGIAMWYGQRRAPGTPLSWGEATAAAAYAFLVMFLAYGIVPHQWLAWADNELSWRADKILVGPGDVLEKLLPFTLTYQVIRDIIAAGIYVVFLGAQVYLWVVWQKRGQPKQKALPTSAYGRPLVKKA